MKIIGILLLFAWILLGAFAFYNLVTMVCDSVEPKDRRSDMTTEEKRKALESYCHDQSACVTCKLSHRGVCICQAIYNIDEAYRILIEDKEPTINEIRNSIGLDPVNRPAHYTDGKIEVIDYIEDKKLGFCLGNAIKYISRAGKKDPTKEIEDLKKAKWYIERRIKELEEA